MEIRVELGKAERYPCELLLLFSFELPARIEGLGEGRSGVKGFCLTDESGRLQRRVI